MCPRMKQSTADAFLNSIGMPNGMIDSTAFPSLLGDTSAIWGSVWTYSRSNRLFQAKKDFSFLICPLYRISRSGYRPSRWGGVLFRGPSNSICPLPPGSLHTPHRARRLPSFREPQKTLLGKSASGTSAQCIVRSLLCSDLTPQNLPVDSRGSAFLQPKSSKHLRQTALHHSSPARFRLSRQT